MSNLFGTDIAEVVLLGKGIFASLEDTLPVGIDDLPSLLSDLMVIVSLLFQDSF